MKVHLKVLRKAYLIGLKSYSVPELLGEVKGSTPDGIEFVQTSFYSAAQLGVNLPEYFGIKPQEGNSP